MGFFLLLQWVRATALHLWMTTDFWGIHLLGSGQSWEWLKPQKRLAPAECRADMTL
jgi:hypothetical protein